MVNLLQHLALVKYNMKKFFFVITLSSFFINHSLAQQNIQKPDFIKIPFAIDGCSGLYTYDSIPLKKQQYIFVTNLQELAFIKIAGKQIKLKETAHKSFPNKTDKTTYTGSGFTVILTTKTVKETGNETGIETGTIEIIKGTRHFSIKIHGEGGC